MYGSRLLEHGELQRSVLEGESERSLDGKRLGARASARYDPALGFVERRGVRQYQPEFEWSPRFDNHGWIRSIDIGVEANIQTGTRNRLLTRELELTVFQINPHVGGRYQFRVVPQYERLEEDFEISDSVVLPAGGIYRSPVIR